MGDSEKEDLRPDAEAPAEPEAEEAGSVPPEYAEVSSLEQEGQAEQAEPSEEPIPAEEPEAAPAKEPYYGTGRRKSSVARVYLRSGSGRVRVNGRSLEEFFPSALWRESAREPLSFVGAADQYDAEIGVEGGGNGGQAGAVRMGLARALAQANPAFRKQLRQNGFLTRDPRMKERKKYGQKGARKRFQWTKR